jgi:hypothetical protein
VNLALAAITAVVVGGAVVAVTARDARATLLGLLVVLLGSALIADPLPGPLPLAARMAAAFLACRLIAVAIRGERVVTSGSRLGWPVEVLAAVAAAFVGIGTHGLGATPAGPGEAQAAGFAVGVLAVAPIVSGRDVLRLGIGAMLLLVGASLVRVGLAGTPSDLEQLVASGLVIGLGGAVAIIVDGSREATGGLEIGGEAARSLSFDGAAARDLLRPTGLPSIHLGREGRGAGRRPVAPVEGTDRPGVDRPGVDRPSPDRPGSGRQGIGRPTADRPTADRPTADRPTADRPTADRPTADRPIADRPASGRPASGRPAPGRPAPGRPAPGRRPPRRPANPPDGDEP